MNYDYYVSSELAKLKVKELREVNRHHHHIEKKSKEKRIISKISALFRGGQTNTKRNIEQCNLQP